MLVRVRPSLSGCMWDEWGVWNPRGGGVSVCEVSSKLSWFGLLPLLVTSQGWLGYTLGAPMPPLLGTTINDDYSCFIHPTLTCSGGKFVLSDWALPSTFADSMYSPTRDCNSQPDRVPQWMTSCPLGHLLLAKLPGRSFSYFQPDPWVHAR